MINVIVELSKYVILTLMVIYTFHCFYLVKQQSEEERNESLRQQLMLIFFMDFTAFLVIYLKTGKFQVVLFYIEMMAFFAGIQILYRIFYKKASILLLNNMCMLLSVGFIMLCRLDVSTATRQLVIVAGVNVVALIVPVLIRKMKFLKDLTWVYAGIGIVLLAAVFVLAMIVTNHEIINVRHIIGGIKFRTFEGLVDKRYGRSHTKYRINQYSLSSRLNQVR